MCDPHASVEEEAFLWWGGRGGGEGVNLTDVGASTKELPSSFGNPIFQYIHVCV